VTKPVRVFGPLLLDAFAFEGSAAVKDLMAALDCVRTTYAAGRRKLPAAPPLRFVPRRWRGFVLGPDGVDRAAYELRAFSELRERLRAGDVWVAGSWKYRAFDDYLLPRPTFEALKASGSLRSRSRPGSRTTGPSGGPSSRRRPPPSPAGPVPATCPTCASTSRV
jgi:hypothetical protein